MRIGVDIDGVLFPWDSVARRIVREQWGPEACSPNPSTTWYGLKNEVTKKVWRWLWSREGQKDVFSRRDAYIHEVEAVRRLIGLGHEVHFVTHRNPAVTALVTAQFIEDNFGGLAYHGLHIVKSSTPKRTLARWDVFVDDKPETVWDFADHTETRVFCPDRPWNTEVETMQYPGGGLVRYTDPQEIVGWVRDHG